MTVNSFNDEFSEYLESVILSNDLLCLTGDFNIHVDDHNDPAACRFLDLLESMSLTQHVAEPTHEHGKTLDLVITQSYSRVRQLYLQSTRAWHLIFRPSSTTI